LYKFAFSNLLYSYRFYLESFLPVPHAAVARSVLVQLGNFCCQAKQRLLSKPGARAGLALPSNIVLLPLPPSTSCSAIGFNWLDLIFGFNHSLMGTV
jgi:hypothetical protein